MATFITFHGGKADKQGPVVTGTCPKCGRAVTFDRTEAHTLLCPPWSLGQRRCPNAKCHTHIFFARNDNGTLITYPSERISFERKGIPDKVIAAFEEAVACHAECCYVAAGIMIRKTLEELCADQNASGKNLKERISDLGGKIVIPKQLLEGMDDLRLLGNDAAHIESQTFNQVSQTEVEVAAEFAREILKAVYQYQDLLERLKGLKKQQTNP